MLASLVSSLFELLFIVIAMLAYREKRSVSLAE